MEAEEKAVCLEQTDNKHRKLLFYFLLLTLNFHSLTGACGPFESLGVLLSSQQGEQ